MHLFALRLQREREGKGRKDVEAAAGAGEQHRARGGEPLEQGELPEVGHGLSRREGNADPDNLPRRARALEMQGSARVRCY